MLARCFVFTGVIATHVVSERVGIFDEEAKAGKCHMARLHIFRGGEAERVFSLLNKIVLGLNKSSIE